MALLDRVIDSRPLLLLAASALAGGVFLTARLGGRGAGSGQAAFEEELAHSRQLDSRYQDGLPRMHAKQQVSRAVSAGQMTLLEAAAHFRALDQLPPEFHWGAFRRTYRGACDEERHCLEVIAHVYSELLDDPGRAAALRSRLQGQLEEHLRRGPLVLPEVTPLDHAGEPQE